MGSQNDESPEGRERMMDMMENYVVIVVTTLWLC